MPIRKYKKGWKIKRGNKPGYYPKFYKTLKKAQERVKQMKSHK